MGRKVFIILVLLGLAPLLRAAPPETPRISFEFVDGFILVKAQAGSSGQPLTLVLDSGAGASVLSLESARRLRLKLGAKEMVDGVGMQTAAYRLDRFTAVAAGVSLGRIPLAVDLSNASDLCSRQIDGLIGVDFFANRIVQIDFDARQISILPSAPLPEAGTARLPIKPLNGTYCIPICVNGSQPRLARFDTGCNDALHWVVPRGSNANIHSNLSIGFLTDPADAVPSALQLGNQFLPNVETSLHVHPLFPGEAGLVGTKILSRFVVTVNSRHGEVIFAPSDAGAK